MKKLVLVLVFLAASSAFAGFGGSRSGGGFSSSRSSFSSGSRSSFGGARSMPSAPIYRPSAPSRSYSAPAAPTHSTTVIHNNSGGGGNGLLTGMMIGHALSQPQQVVVAPAVQPVAVGGAMVAEPVVIQPSSWMDFFLKGVLALVVIMLIVGGCILLMEMA